MNFDSLLLTLKSDLLTNILEYASDVQKCAESITLQIREMIAAKVVAVFERDPTGAYRLLAACPERNGEIFQGEEIRGLVASAGCFLEAIFIEPGKGEAGRILADLGMKESFFVPLRVEEESFGMLILLDLMDNKGIEQILLALKDISGLLSLVFKNSFLFRNMDSLVLQRTRALQESELRSQLILQTAMDGFWCVDPKGSLIEVNDSYCHMVGYSRSELLKMTIQQLEAIESQEEIAAHLERVLAGEYACFETLHRHKDGHLLNLEVCAQMRVGSDEKEIVAFLRDITERTRLEEERKSMQAQLQQAQKMEAIGTLAGGIAHDFNNILGAILGYAELAQEDSPAGSMVRKDIDQVIKASHRAKDLVKQILAFSRHSEITQIPVQPGQIIKEAVKMLRASLPSTISIQKDIDPEAGFILADPTQIHQVLVNLCTNAFHAMEETGGTLGISLKRKTLIRDDLGGEPHVQPGKFVQLSISDTGSGIAPEIRGKIFDPYFTTKEVGKGTGMGLAIIHGIAKSYKGFVICHSEPGEGTVFQVYLPVIADPALLEVEAAPLELTQLGNERILYIDDEEILAEMGQTMLERLGYTVTVRRSSLDALNTFQNQPDRFDLVITDQTMPGMTGSDLARRMLQIRPGMPIILCTGYSTLISEEKARSLGIKGFAMKPLAKKDIAALVRMVLDGGKSIS